MSTSDPSPGTSLAELFARDPLHYDREGKDLRIIVERMRQAQAQFEMGIKAPVAARPKRGPTKSDLLADLGLVDGDDLTKLGL